ncbi:uncharacterized protein B0H18DRAFT_1013250 [Fomitopsis serialis]|uniref:uncharacterized protein n=1 Tax=Fomitopsis serialis TaxID=139415 RepID=UPI0020075448|nr:uncharacterized protein B0H18DRAFT_1013250 [Neoantrodia serialis]KAH9924056.1 hypothetical protein B0H18DRAFT_1013250 [Neoantrodia serialis]
MMYFTSANYTALLIASSFFSILDILASFPFTRASISCSTLRTPCIAACSFSFARRISPSGTDPDPDPKPSVRRTRSTCVWRSDTFAARSSAGSGLAETRSFVVGAVHGGSTRSSTRKRRCFGRGAWSVSGSSRRG